MKISHGLGLLVAVTGMTVLLAWQVRAAEDLTVLTQTQIDGVSKSCRESKQQLRQLHASDALIRVNIGQEYENISSRLMAPLNSRIALNGLDGVVLSQTTVSYNEDLLDFKSAYQVYSEGVVSALDIDCQEDPVEYYARIENARRLRAKLAETITRLNRNLTQYEMQFEAFVKSADIGKS